jgi:hypothetical protein
VVPGLYGDSHGEVDAAKGFQKYSNQALHHYEQNCKYNRKAKMLVQLLIIGVNFFFKLHTQFKKVQFDITALASWCISYLS